MDKLMLQEYGWNKTFREAVNSYMSKNECTLEQAMQTAEVRRLWQFERDL